MEESGDVGNGGKLEAGAVASASLVGSLNVDPGLSSPTVMGLGIARIVGGMTSLPGLDAFESGVAPLTKSEPSSASSVDGAGAGDEDGDGP